MRVKWKKNKNSSQCLPKLKIWQNERKLKKEEQVGIVTNNAKLVHVRGYGGGYRCFIP